MRSDITGSASVLCVPVFIEVLFVYLSVLGVVVPRPSLHVDHGFAHVITLLHGIAGSLMIWPLELFRQFVQMMVPFTKVWQPKQEKPLLAVLAICGLPSSMPWRNKRRSNLRCTGPAIPDQLHHYDALEAGHSTWAATS